MELVQTIASVTARTFNQDLSSQTTYKPSRFNARTTLVDGTVILFNSATGRQCAIPPNLVDSLRSYLSQDTPQAIKDQLGRYLQKNGYIVSNETDELSRFSVQHGLSHFRTDTLQLMLLSSEECNFRCIYCSQQFKRGSMKPHVRKGVINLFESRLFHIRQFSLSWFGGEPLLGFDAIKEIAPYVQRRCQEQGVKFSSHMTTNAYLLNAERSRYIIEWGVKNFQITLDGSALEHDKHRPLKDGGSTFYTILENLKSMRDTDSSFNVVLRMNYDHENATALGSAFEYLAKEFGGDSRFVMRFRPVGRWGGPNDKELNVCGLNDERATLVQLDTKARAAGLATEPFSQDLKPNSVCYAARPYHIIVGADGKLMKCSVVLDTMPENIIGAICPDGHIEINEARFSEWVKPFYSADKTCQKCFFLPSCQGASCPLPRFEGKRPCPTVKVKIQQTLKDVYAQHSRA